MSFGRQHVAEVAAEVGGGSRRLPAKSLKSLNYGGCGGCSAEVRGSAAKSLKYNAEVRVRKLRRLDHTTYGGGGVRLPLRPPTPIGICRNVIQMGAKTEGNENGRTCRQVRPIGGGGSPQDSHRLRRNTLMAADVATLLAIMAGAAKIKASAPRTKRIFTLSPSRRERPCTLRGI